MVLRQLQQVVAEQLPVLLAVREAEGNPLPWIALREFRLFLTCDEPAFGYAVLLCESCGLDFKIAFTCKRRSFCPCCIERRREERTRHLMDRVLPDLPYRHWVLCLPVELRLNLAYYPELISGVRRCFIEAVFHHLREAARHADPSLTVDMIHPGAITFGHRVSANLTANAHFHCLPFDGVLVQRVADGPLEFLLLDPPTEDEIAAVAVAVCRSVCDMLARHGKFKPDRSLVVVSGESGEISLRKPSRNSRQRWTTVRYFGRAVVGSDEELTWTDPGEPFDVFARDRVEQGDRKGLENLVRYLLAPPFRLDQLRFDAHGNVVLELKRRRRDGTTHVTFTPYEFVTALIPLIPRPRTHAIEYHGVLARNAHLRKRVVPVKADPAPRDTATVCKDQMSETEIAWKQLHVRAHRETFLRCPYCRRRLVLLAMVGKDLRYRDPRWRPPDTPSAPAAEPALG